MGLEEFRDLRSAAVIGAFVFASILQFIFRSTPQTVPLRKNWRINITLAALNAAVMTSVYASTLVAAARRAESLDFGLCNFLDIPLPAKIVLAIFALDLTAYFWHRANHQVSKLWSFHSIHHSDDTYDVSTGVRFHLGEVVISLFIRLLSVFLLGLPVEGILAFEIAYGLFNFIEHGRIRIPQAMDDILKIFFVTPSFHLIHHSMDRDDYNSNFGTIFSLWDRAFHTKNSRPIREPFSVGLSKSDHWKDAVVSLLIQPFRSRKSN